MSSVFSVCNSVTDTVHVEMMSDFCIFVNIRFSLFSYIIKITYDFVSFCNVNMGTKEYLISQAGNGKEKIMDGIRKYYRFLKLFYFKLWLKKHMQFIILAISKCTVQ